jgi:hypothetical protein
MVAGQFQDDMGLYMSEKHKSSYKTQLISLLVLFSFHIKALFFYTGNLDFYINHKSSLTYCFCSSR